VEAERLIYVCPAVESCRVLLEGVVAATPVSMTPEKHLRYYGDEDVEMEAPKNIMVIF
jgi:hypothetical protein